MFAFSAVVTKKVLLADSERVRRRLLAGVSSDMRNDSISRLLIGTDIRLFLRFVNKGLNARGRLLRVLINPTTVGGRSCTHGPEMFSSGRSHTYLVDRYSSRSKLHSGDDQAVLLLAPRSTRALHALAI